MNANPSTTSPATSRLPIPRDVSEAEFLRLRSEQQQASLADSFELLKKSLGTAADLNLWAQHHPWLTVGVAAAAGFAAGNVIFGRRDPAPQAPAAPPQQNAGLMGSLTAPLFDLMKVALHSALAGAMAGATQAQTADATGDAPLGAADQVATPPPLI